MSSIHSVDQTIAITLFYRFSSLMMASTCVKRKS